MAVYTAEDAKEYINTELKVTIIRDICEENQTVLYTKEGEYAPDCTKDGIGHTECRICGDIVRDGIKVPATGHTEGTPVIVKATINKDGSIISKCIKCNTVLNNTVINKAAKIELSPKVELIIIKSSILWYLSKIVKEIFWNRELIIIFPGQKE